jgi:ATP-dependent Lon protease
MVVPLFVGREKSIAALERAMGDDKAILLAAQKKAKIEEPSRSDIYNVGTLGTILQLLRLPDGTVKVLVEGKQRAEIKEYIDDDECFMVEAQEVDESGGETVEAEALVRSTVKSFESYVKFNKRIPPEMIVSVTSIESPGRLADTIASHLTVKLEEKQALLAISNPVKRLERLYSIMESEIEILEVEQKIRSRVKKQMEKTQKEYYLSEQMKAIQKELGEKDDFKGEIQEFEDRIKKKKMSKEATKKARQELKKLKMMSPMSAEATVSRNFIDWIVGLPWGEETKENEDLTAAEEVLDRDHYGLKPVKERIVEYLAVRSLVDEMKGPILCLVGPPGVGKTSLAPRPSENLYRKHAGQGDTVAQEGRKQQPGLSSRRGGQDGARLQGRPRKRAPRGPRSRAEPHLQRPLPRLRLRSVEDNVLNDRELGSGHTVPAPRPHGDNTDPGLHRA